MRGDGDGWQHCGLGHRHWGVHGAAGLLLRRSAPEDEGGAEVLLQLRALWSHHGGTWGLPGGARDSDESAAQAALREAAEEVGLDPAEVRLSDELVDDHGDWSYTTVIGDTDGDHALPEPHPGAETIEVRWVGETDVDLLPLHPGFAATWPRLRR